MNFIVKDSGERIDYPSGMRRDIQDGKRNYLLVRDGPMLSRWADQLTKGADKYGKRNWQLANSEEEYDRFRESAARHFEQWLKGDTDEDHAAATFFNINAAEYVKDRGVFRLDTREKVLKALGDSREDPLNPLTPRARPVYETRRRCCGMGGCGSSCVEPPRD